LNAKEEISSQVEGTYPLQMLSTSLTEVHSHQSATQPGSSEQLALDAEMDGTILGDEMAEEKRSKDENWARFTDENPRGQGNTMNRG
jgi:hypothetical protein